MLNKDDFIEEKSLPLAPQSSSFCPIHMPRPFINHFTIACEVAT